MNQSKEKLGGIIVFLFFVALILAVVLIIQLQDEKMKAKNAEFCERNGTEAEDRGFGRVGCTWDNLDEMKREAKQNALNFCIKKMPKDYTIIRSGKNCDFGQCVCAYETVAEKPYHRCSITYFESENHGWVEVSNDCEEF